MTQPETVETSGRTTGQKAINTATAGATALLVSEGCKAFMLVFYPQYAGKAPQLAFAIGVAAAALMGTIGSVARAQLASAPPTSFFGKLGLSILANAG